ncbi:MAG: hypothetical protein JW829_18790 [Pirellulales bacterium]|nr:hypothetical protein [Pirellulales bacterium]
MDLNDSLRRAGFVMMAFMILAAGHSILSGQVEAPQRPLAEDILPEGYVRGDVVSYSYVPIRTWRPKEGIGILPYLFEYSLMAFENGKPLEELHVENVRRIDIASQWSTAIMLYARHDHWQNEIINLMIRCFRNRQLIVLANYYNRKGEDGGPYGNVQHILALLWGNRDQVFVSPEGDQATGRQLINNILACKCGDEEESGLGTAGLREVYAQFDRVIRFREADGQRPFRHIKAWYNMIGYAALDYNGAYAASRQDIDKHGRIMLPENTQCIGVDVYHYWGHGWSPFDPADLSIPRNRVRGHANEWQRLRTRYYPAGLQVRVCRNSHDPKTWVPECWNDTHALMGAIELAGARDAMMWYIGVSGQLSGNGSDPATYTTPIETMAAYYDELKAGPWVALSWWVFGNFSPTCHGGLEYYDKTIRHYTPEHPEGESYSPQMLDYWHDAYVGLKMRMFHDVVHNQFRHLNGPAPKENH